MTIFDRIMSRGFLKRFEPFYKAHKEMLLYLFFGGCTTVVGFIFFAIPVKLLNLQQVTLFGLTLDMNTIVSNVISWIAAVTFAYITNRIWVFEHKAHGGGAIAKECAAFFAGRLFTLLVELVLMNLSVTKLGMDELIAKIIVSVVTIILNYVVSKLFVFKKKSDA